MVDRYFLECGGLLRLADGSDTDEDIFIKYSDYAALEAKLSALVETLRDIAEDDCGCCNCSEWAKQALVLVGAASFAIWQDSITAEQFQQLGKLTEKRRCRE